MIQIFLLCQYALSSIVCNMTYWKPSHWFLVFWVLFLLYKLTLGKMPPNGSHDEDDFTLADPFLWMIGLKSTNRNRQLITLAFILYNIVFLSLWIAFNVNDNNYLIDKRDIDERGKQRSCH